MDPKDVAVGTAGTAVERRTIGWTRLTEALRGHRAWPTGHSCKCMVFAGLGISPKTERMGHNGVNATAVTAVRAHTRMWYDATVATSESQTQCYLLDIGTDAAYTIETSRSVVDKRCEIHTFD